MSLNVGGLYVRVQKGVTQAKVVAEITAYWTKLGATKLDGDPSELSPLELEKTGKLGFAVAKNKEWIAVYDSERYRADPALARHLATTFDTAVAHYEMHGATDHAYYNVYGDGPKPAKKTWDEIEVFVAETFPWPFLYFNKLEEEKKTFELFGFENIPPRPKAQYTGPSKKQLGKQGQLDEAKRLGEAGKIAELRALYKAAPHVKDAIRDVVKYAKDPNFVVAFADICAEDPWTNKEVGVAAAKLRDWKIFKRAIDSAKDESNFVLWESSAWEMYQAGDVEGAHAIYSAIVDLENPSLTAWNNYVGTLKAIKPADKKKLAAAEKLGAKNPSIFHNLACLYAKTGDKERAFEAIENAVRHGYTGIAKMKADEELASLRKDKRFAKAFAVEVAAFDLAELDTSMKIHKKLRAVTRPVIGMYFFFRTSAATNKIVADIVRSYAPGKLTHVRHGHWKKVDAGNLKRWLTKLEKLPKTHYYDVAFRDGDGDATDVCAHVDIQPDADEICGLYLSFPRTMDAESAYGEFTALAARLPYESGSCGYTLQTRDDCGVYEDVSIDEDGMREKCLGFEHHPNRTYEPGKLAAHWLTLVGDKLVEKLGGEKALAKAIGKATIARVGAGLCIRAAKRVPIGAVAKPDDLGAIPAVALALKKLRPDDERYARFDAIPPSAFEN